MREIELPETCTGSPPRRPPGSRTAGVGRLAGICFAPGEKLPVCRIFAQNGKWVHIVCGWPARSHKQNRARVCGRAPWRDSRGAAPGTACRAPTNRCGRVSPVALRKMRRATFPGHEDTEAQRRRKGCRAKGRGATFTPEANPIARRRASCVALDRARRAVPLRRRNLTARNAARATTLRFVARARGLQRLERHVTAGDGDGLFFLERQVI